MYLVDTLHQNGIGVLLDWVPAHFPKDFFALPHFDGTHLYEHQDPRQGEHQDWGTLIFNYSRPEVRCFLVGSAMTWLDRYHIDGLRVDAVASMLYLDYSRKPGQWIPNKYRRAGKSGGALIFSATPTPRRIKYFPGVLMIAEESTAWGGVTKPAKESGLGFDLKWNMGWMHDTLEYFKKDPIHRKYHHNQLTFGMIYQNTERFMMAFSHDEVVHGKCSLLLKMGADHIPDKAQAASRPLRLDVGLARQEDPVHGRRVCPVRRMGLRQEPRLASAPIPGPRGRPLAGRGPEPLLPARTRFCPTSDYDSLSFQWVNNNDGNNSVISFVRHGAKPEDMLLVVANLTPVPRPQYRVGVPREGLDRGVEHQFQTIRRRAVTGISSRCKTQPIKWDGRPQAVDLFLPGMAVMFFLFTPVPAAGKEANPAMQETSPKK